MSNLQHPELYTVVDYLEGVKARRFADAIQAERLRTQLVEAYVQKELAKQSRDLDPQVVISTLRKQAKALYCILPPQP